MFWEGLSFSTFWTDAIDLGGIQALLNVIAAIDMALFRRLSGKVSLLGCRSGGLHQG